MTRTSHHLPQARQHPDPIRIVAISASIAFNVAMIAVLMRPMEFTPARAQDESHPVTIIVPDPKPLVEPIKVKPLLQPAHKTVALSTPHQQAQPVVTEKATPVSTEVIAPPPTDDTIDTGNNTPPGPVDASLTPISSPAPTYPLIALREGITGTVELELLVGVDGRVLEARVTRSSGNHMLDNAAREQVLRGWLFKPAIRNGIAVQARGILPIAFTLDGR
mgnify:CR=1 FL=1